LGQRHKERLKGKKSRTNLLRWHRFIKQNPSRTCKFWNFQASGSYHFFCPLSERLWTE
jgi:hypothetical protein